MYYLSMVRNIVSNIDTPRLLDNLRQHLSKSKISHGYYMTKEISPDNNQLHIHTIISLKSIDESHKMIYFINTHHLKAYVDKVIKLPSDIINIHLFLKYIRKDITHESQIYINYMFKNYEDSVWDCILNYNIDNTDSIDDPFID